MPTQVHLLWIDNFVLYTSNLCHNTKTIQILSLISLTDCEINMWNSLRLKCQIQWPDVSPVIRFESQGNTHVLTGKFNLTNVNNMAFYISGPKLLFETTEISTHPNWTQLESNYIYLYTTKFGTSITIRLNRKFQSTEFETMRVNCNSILD